MESQNIDRRDSKKANKNGGSKSQTRGGGGGGGVGRSSTGGGSGSGDKQRSHSQKSGKRYQEIYKPPSLRSSKNRNSNSCSEQPTSLKGNNQDDGIQSSGMANFSSKMKNNSSNQPTTSGAGGKPIGNLASQFNGNDMNNDPSNNAYSLFGNNNTSVNNGNSSVPSSPLMSSRMQNSFNFGLAKRMFNVNAKEFQFLPIQQQQQQHQQQLSNFLSQFDPNLFYNNSPILASSGCYPLKQSKSSGNMNLLLQQAQQQQQVQAAAIQQLQIAMGLNASLQSGNFSTGNNNGSNSQFNRLSQSKSSGNVPSNGSRPRVRFDDEETGDFDDADDDIIGGQLGNYLASLKMNGDLPGMSQTNFPMGFPFQQHQQQQMKQPNKAVPLSPQPVLKSSLQKSRTGFYLNLYGNQQQQQQQQQTHQQQQQQQQQTHQQQLQLGSPTKQTYGFNPIMHPGANHASKLISSPIGSTGVVKRSRSFGPGNHHLPKASATAFLSASSVSTSTGHSVYSDFCITKWPRVVQELVTAAVTGVERIPARNWIEMVNGIFDAMLCDYHPTKNDKNTTSSLLSDTAASSSVGKNENADPAAAENNDRTRNYEEEEDDDDEDDIDLTSAAVHIFLYFIQREKDRTVMESLLNTCFASFQRLSNSSSSAANPSSGKSARAQKIMDQMGKPSISRQWCNFLRFLSSLYSQVKLIRRQKQSQQQPGHSMDEMSFSLLALLCDSCLATLRSPQSYTAEMMGCLFTVLTSIGRDMEGTFPLKMKQLLAAVRDALLGIGPYHHQQQQQHHQHQHSSNSSSTSTNKSVSSLSPIVQKTLMQLIELHAANWQLPASAVRYYYSSVSNSKSTSSSGGTFFGKNQNQSPKGNDTSGSSGATTTTSQKYISPTAASNTILRPSSSSSVSSNDNDEAKDSSGSSVTSTTVVSSIGSMPGIEEKGNSAETGSDEKKAKDDGTVVATEDTTTK